MIFLRSSSDALFIRGGEGGGGWRLFLGTFDGVEGSGEQRGQAVAVIQKSSYCERSRRGPNGMRNQPRGMVVKEAAMGKIMTSIIKPTSPCDVEASLLYIGGGGSGSC